MCVSCQRHEQGTRRSQIYLLLCRKTLRGEIDRELLRLLQSLRSSFESPKAKRLARVRKEDIFYGDVF